METATKQRTAKREVIRAYVVDNGPCPVPFEWNQMAAAMFRDGQLERTGSDPLIYTVTDTCIEIGVVTRSILEERVLSRLQTNDETACWEWPGASYQYGHGHVRIFNRDYAVHRLVYEILIGPIPEGLVLDHLCSNPPCANPDHLEPVTNQVNIRRWADKYLEENKTCKNGHLLEGDNLMITKRADRNGHPHIERYCRECNKVNCKAYHAKKREPHSLASNNT